MNNEIEQIIEENKDSANEFTYIYFPFNAIYQMQEENQLLKYNWNKLKEHLKEKISEERSRKNLWLIGCYDEDKLIFEKMEELEQGSDSNVKD